MNITQLTSYYKESLIQMIYESCQQKHQLFSSIAQLSEVIQKKSQKDSHDNSIEDLLSQLKVMIQYANQDISTHIDLALQQIAISKRIQMKIFPKKQESNSSTEETEKIPKGIEKPKFNQPDEEIKNQAVKKQPSRKIPKSKSQQNDSSEEEDVDEENNDDDDYDIEQDSFKLLQKTLDSLEEDHSVKASKNFRDKNFFLETQKKGNSILKVITEDDMKFIYELSKVLETQRKIAVILRIDSRVISKIIQEYKKSQGIEISRLQRNYGKGKRKPKNKTTSGNSISNTIDMQSENDEEISMSTQIVKEKVFNPFVKENSKEVSLVKKVRFQEEELLKVATSENQQKVAKQIKEPSIMVKVEESTVDTECEITGSQSDKPAKKQQVKHTSTSTNTSVLQEKGKPTQATKQNHAPKPAPKQISKPQETQNQKNIQSSGQSQKLIQYNNQKKQTLVQKK